MINRTILQGRLVSDPVMKYTPSNVAMAQVSVAWSSQTITRAEGEDGHPL